jgi:hypothetical protein
MLFLLFIIFFYFSLGTKPQIVGEEVANPKEGNFNPILQKNASYVYVEGAGYVLKDRKIVLFVGQDTAQSRRAEAIKSIEKELESYWKWQILIGKKDIEEIMTEGQNNKMKSQKNSSEKNIFRRVLDVFKVADAINVVRDTNKTCDCDDALLLLAGKDLHLIQTTLNPDGGAVGNTIDSDVKNLKDIASQGQFLKLPQKDPEVGGDGKEAPFLVGIIDSGVNFGDEIVTKNERFITPYVNTSLNYNFLKKNVDVRDTLEHGTKIARIILKNTGLKNLNLVALKTFDTTKVGNLYDNLCAILYSIKHKVRVVNTSWGAFSEKPIPVFEEVLRRAKTANMVVVCSAGNIDVDIDLHPYYPACYADHSELGSHVITVTSIYYKKVCQNYSLSGKKIDLTVDATNKNCEHLIPDNLGNMTAPTESGTSYAAPYVTAGLINYINGSSSGYSKSGYIGAIPAGSIIRAY